MSQLRIGIVGAGSIARARHIPLLQAHPDATVVAISDVSREAIDRATMEFNIPFGYTDYQEMFEQENLDAISICTPNKFHAPVAIAALQKGLHVLCEKPMALNAAEGREMVRVAKETGKILMIAYRYRWQARAQAAKRVIDSGELGEIYMIRVNALRRRGIPSWGVFTNKEMQGGGALVDFGVHLLDLALWLAGNPRPLEVSGTISQRLGSKPGVNIWGAWNHENFEVEDQAAAFVRLEGGKALQMEVSWALNIPESQETISLSGTEGGLDVYPLKVNRTAHGMLINWEPTWMPGEKTNEWELQMNDFVESVLQGRQPLVKPEEALAVSEIVDAIYQSAATEAAIRIG
jgi:predicted dehydrogenase